MVAVGVTGVAVGHRVMVGETVAVGGRGEGVSVMVGVELGVGVRLGVSVGVGTVGVGDGVSVRVAVGHVVMVGVFEGVGVGVALAVGEEVQVGGWPSTVNSPTTRFWVPMKICTWYKPGSHSSALGSQSEKPAPPVPHCQGLVSK